MRDLEEIKQAVLDCKLCELRKTSRKSVPGFGNPHASIVLVGEAPGAAEIQKGKPFQGRAGQCLNNMLQEAGICRDDLYITNVVKCRPPENRTPTTQEIEKCSGYLWRELEIIQPRIIVCLGATAFKELAGHAYLNKSITEVRGKVLSISCVGFNTINIIPTWHPAFVLRGGRGERMLQCIEDLKKAKEKAEFRDDKILQENG